MIGGDVMVGYRKAVGTGWLTAYVGGAFEHHGAKDPTASIRGSEGGVKGVIEYWTPITQELWLYANGSYSTVFDSWNAFGRIGYKLTPQITIGPEGSLFGNNAPYREWRVGAFVSFAMLPWGELSVAGGYRQPLTPGPDGYYANATLGFPFH